MIGRQSRVRRVFPWFAVVALAACVDTTDPGSENVCWLDFVKLDGITYLGIDLTAGRDLKESDLDEQIGTVEFMLSGNVNDRNYEPKDGDAAFLEPGTPVHRVKGYEAWFRVAAKTEDRIYLYEADYNPDAVRGSDIFDLEGAVDSIAVYASGVPTYRLGVIRDPAVIASMVKMVSEAELKEPEPVNPGHYFVVFHLKDGTTTVRPFWPSAGRLGGRAVVPQAFGDAILEAIGKGTPEPNIRLRSIGRICSA